MSAGADSRHADLLGQALDELRRLRAERDAAQRAAAEPIAVIGLACHFPGGADGPAAFWSMLRDGVDAVGLASSRRSPAAVGEGGGANQAALLAEVDGFDAGFFGVPDREARVMDPQQRLLLETAWEAIEDGGCTLERLREQRAGVFVGVYQNDYLLLQLLHGEDIGVFTAPGSAHSIVANRLSYAFDLTGPSVAVDTACSSSLVATHLACQSLRAGDCDIALAGGVNLILGTASTVMTEKVLTLAPGGRCRAFDAAADGIVRAEGCGVVLLARESDALANGDRIIASIRGSAVNQDGRTNGLTAPNPVAQEQLLRRALAGARVAPADVGYVEAHGTGTPLGDPIEVEALASVYGSAEGRTVPCAIGSVKANIGHAEAAAGIAGLIKALLVVQHGEIPRHVHFKRANPGLDLAGGRLVVPIAAGPWPDAAPRLAAVSSFGFGGTNAHVVLQQAPAPRPRDMRPRARPAADGETLVLALSARSADALAAMAERYRDLLRDGDLGAPLADACATLGARRTHHAHRLAVHGAGAAELAASLDRRMRAGAPRSAPAARDGVVMAFSGQGSQWPGMGVELARREPVFRAELERCDAELRSLTGWSLLEELESGEEHSRLGRTDVAQCGIFAVQVGLVALWRSWGIEPDAVLGHSVGEIAAAHVAGALDRADALRLLHHRGRLMRAAPRGRMASVAIDEARARALCEPLAGRVGVAAVNAPGSCVLSGDPEGVDELTRVLAAEGVAVRELRVDRAFHSQHMAPLRGELVDVLAGLAPRPPRMPMYSTVTGALVEGAALDASYWGRNLAEGVRLTDAVAALAADGYRVVLEVGPHSVLASPIADTLAGLGAEGLVVPSLRRGRPELAALLASLCRLYEAGLDPAWAAIQGVPERPAELPAYPWQRRRFWVGRLDPAPAPAVQREGAALRTRVSAASADTARELVLGFLVDRVAAALGRSGEPAAEVDPAQPVTSLGLGSLAVVELKNEIERELDVALPLTLLTEAATLDEVGGRLSTHVRGDDAGDPMTSEEARDMLGRIQDLTEADVAAALTRLGGSA